MRTYTYGLRFSPYPNKIKAKNMKEAKIKIAQLWKDYDKVLTFLI